MRSITAAFALVVLCSVSASTAAGRTLGKQTRTYTAAVTSSRGYRFTLTVTLRQPPVATLRPGFNVGQTSVALGRSWVSLRVRNQTSGRPLDVLSPGSFISVVVLWKAPPGLPPDDRGVPRSYIKSVNDFGGGDLLQLGPGAASLMPLPPGYTSANASSGGADSVSKRDVARLLRLFTTRPMYVAVTLLSDSDLDGSWDACSDGPVVTSFTGTGRQAKLTPALCDAIVNTPVK